MRLTHSTSRARAASRAGRIARRATVAVATAGLVAAATAVLAAPASAETSPTAHDPLGNQPTVTAVTGGLQFHGWAVDPDAQGTNVTVVGLVDGRTVAASRPTSSRWADITKKYPAAQTPSYTLTVPVATTSKHTVCLVERNIGAGLDAVRRCVTTPLATRLTSAQLAAHNPVGAITGWANAHSVHYTGWTSDPDDVARPLLAVLYVDGSPARTAATVVNPAPVSSAGPTSRIDILVPVSVVGTHIGCVWIVNVGLGTNSFLGCRAVDNRTPGYTQGVPYTPAPAVNAKILAEAKTHLGSRYVWGAAGPKTFDCSGLVQYSYKKFGLSTPRISEDQVTAARLIPASHARPGDLVFYHDTEGDVYHVGIYSAPGMTVAAVDPESGVRYQSIDTSSATYGSFTHT